VAFHGICNPERLLTVPSHVKSRCVQQGYIVKYCCTRSVTSCIEHPHLETRLGLLLRLLAITTRQTTASLPCHPSLPAECRLVTFAFL